MHKKYILEDILKFCSDLQGQNLEFYVTQYLRKGYSQTEQNELKLGSGFCKTLQINFNFVTKYFLNK